MAESRNSANTVTLGGASGYWGESDMAWAQLIGASPDYLVFDYLAEITMSLLARMRARDPQSGWVPDFAAGLARHLPDIASRRIKVIANAGGVNPEACAEAARRAVAAAGLELKVSVVTGDELMDRLDVLEGRKELFSGESFPETDRILSANAYLGAFPIARALDAGADIVITGRCVDSAVTLGALIHEFGWGPDELDRLAQGSLVGHLIECGPQVTGGNFTDWREAGDIARIGYPLAEVEADGTAVITKPDGTQGIVNRGTVAEQMLY
ncbi:MAG: acyclic terpene utilization AtuA family protein, partial [Pseudomonadota bacterium]